ncbi:hypothetical protein PTI98_000294 [Pleurotus ostreatus]|nr:hypothetical protein PTI98_000294 [Pleurotus ostreatus]
MSRKIPDIFLTLIFAGLLLVLDAGDMDMGIGDMNMEAKDFQSPTTGTSCGRDSLPHGTVPPVPTYDVR